MNDYVEGVEEVTIENTGESYSNSNGISLFSTGDSINNYSDTDGSYYATYKVLWTVTEGASTGTVESIGNGITGHGWFIGAQGSPFKSPITNEEIEAYAINNRNLNTYFNTWIATTDDDDIQYFVMRIAPYDCIDFITGSGTLPAE